MVKKRILIVEDEIYLGKMLQARLEDMGYQAPWLVPTGEEAIQIAHQVRPDLILMDIKLAGDIDGIEAGSRIRSSLKIPIIYLTSHVNDSYISRAKLTEPLAYLLKPVHSVELRTNIEMAFVRDEIERRLIESERRYRALVESQVELVCRYTPQGALTYVNDSYCRYYNKSRDQLIGNRFGLPELRRKNARSILDQKEVTSQDPVRSFETRDVASDGKPRFQRWTEVSLFDDQGVITEIQGVGRDITERKLTEVDTLYRIEERFRAVFDSVTDCIFIMDSQLRYTHVNAASSNLLGITEPQIVGCKPEKVFGPEIGRKLDSIYAKVLSGESAQFQQMRTISGAELTFSETAAPLKNVHGKVIGIFCICRNITEQKNVVAGKVHPYEKYLSESMRQTMIVAQSAGGADGTVCLLGESGSGKDHLARWIHDHSRRRSGPFLAINCAVLPESLAESELFGHERGAFSGASVQKRGLLELAEGGTILLNEIGELSPALQAKLLSFIDTKTFLRVGGVKPNSVDSRLMAATHRRLEEEVAHGRFIGPLFHRINVFPIVVPPLRNRLEDIPALCAEIIQKLNREIPLSSTPSLGIEHYRTLSNYHWPGNVRELRNVLERSLMLWKGKEFILQLPVTEMTQTDWAFSIDAFEHKSLNDITSEVVASVCREMVLRCNGNKSRAAKRLGISRDALYRHLRKNGHVLITDSQRPQLS